MPETNAESRPEASLPSPPALSRPLLFVLAGLLGLYSLLFAYHALRFAFATAELHYAEGTWFFSALRVRHGLSPYFDYRHSPYIAMIYPPLDPGIAGLLGALFGLSDVAMVPLTRLVSVGATLLTCAGVLFLCRKLGAALLPSVIAGLLVLTPEDTWKLWGHVARSDMLAVGLGVWALAFVARTRDAPVWKLALGGALAGLGIAAKQTEIAPLLACVWWLLPDWRRAASFLGSAVVAVAAVLLPLGLGGIRLLVRAMLDLSAQPTIQDALFGRLGDLVRLAGPLIPLALVGLTAGLGRPGWGLLVRYAALALFVFLITAGKVGTASQYTLELIALLCVLSGLGIQWLLDLLRREASREVHVGALTVVIALLGVQLFSALLSTQSWSAVPPDERPLLDIPAVRNGPILSENGYVALRGEEPPVMLDPYYFSVLSALGRWDEMPLAQQVRERQFSAVLLSRPVETPFVYHGIRWIPPAVLGAVAANYRLLTTQGRYYVYVPR